MPVTAARPGIALALAASFSVAGFYTTFASLSTTPPVGDLIVPPAGAAALVAVLVASALYLTWNLRRSRMPLGPTAPILAVWIGAVALASALGFDPALGFAVVANMLFCAAIHLAILRWYGAPGVARALIVTFLVTGTLAVAAALVMQALHVPGPLYVLNNGRAAGIFVTANQLAAFLVTFTPAAFGVALAASGALRALGGTAAAVGFAGMYETYSRSGWIALVVAGGVLALARGGRRYAAPIAVGVAAVVAMLILNPDTHHNRSESFNRLAVWRTGIRVASRFPLTGVGAMSYWRVYPDLRAPDSEPPGSFSALHPHNVVLSFAADAGLVGLAALAWGWWRYVRQLSAEVARVRGRSRWFALSVCAGLAGTLAQGMVDTVGVVEMTFVWIPFMGLALAAAAGGLGTIAAGGER